MTVAGLAGWSVLLLLVINLLIFYVSGTVPPEILQAKIELKSETKDDATSGISAQDQLKNDSETTTFTSPNNSLTSSIETFWAAIIKTDTGSNKPEGSSGPNNKTFSGITAAIEELLKSDNINNVKNYNYDSTSQFWEKPLEQLNSTEKTIEEKYQKSRAILKESKDYADKQPMVLKLTNTNSLIEKTIQYGEALL